ncbi:hypothetical protein AU381_08095 [Sinorhizobium glycinis]|uniref:Uncharacterized protein n=1 Tax=Sinorhizobium glycinis TaxID=1472378 RepID=A0A178XX66_9HYPH|nr:hypothetical protein AU381_08095 [Sinorhizobium glycinis]
MLGAAKLISVHVRDSLVALRTPDELRGSVNAVNAVFVGASNELGEFRAPHGIGLRAVFAVVFGGPGTPLGIAALGGRFPAVAQDR